MHLRILCAGAIALAVMSFASGAEARHARPARAGVITCDDRGCSPASAQAPAEHATKRPDQFVAGAHVRCDERYQATCDRRGWREGRPREDASAPAASAPASGAGSIVAHPAGCPHVAFCGCGAAIEVFGRPIRALWLAANWLRFPRAEPAPGMAAVRQHHVMVIREYLGNNRAIVYDANSGGHKTRVHERSLAGYTIVNPKERNL